MKTSSIKGISIVEIIVAATIIAVCVVGIVGAIRVYMQVVYQNTRETQAVLLLDETAEALQHIRDDQEYEMLNDTEYAVFWDGSGYGLSTSTPILPYGMTQTVVFSEVTRNGSDQIAESGTVDPDTQLATITIEWPYRDTTKIIVSEMLIHHMYD